MVTTFQHQEPAPRVALASAVALMVHYFDIREGDAWAEVLSLSGYNPPSWIRIAVIEALYQGRYKVISVQQILEIWRRRGKMLAHFNREFEAIVTVPLPDRVQAQLRNLAREHQLEHRQQRQHQDTSSQVSSQPETLSQTSSQEERRSISPISPEQPLSSRSSGQSKPPEATPPDTSAYPESVSYLESSSRPESFIQRLIAISPAALVPAALKPPIPTSDRISRSPEDDLGVDLLPSGSKTQEPETQESKTQEPETQELMAQEPETQESKTKPDSPNVPSPSSSHPNSSLSLNQPLTEEGAKPETDLVSPASKTLSVMMMESSWSPSFRRSSAQIDQFCPTPDPSGFDRKLLALANQS